MTGLWNTPADKRKNPFAGIKINPKMVAKIKREFEPSEETQRLKKMFEDGQKATRRFVSTCLCHTGGVCFFHTKF